MKLRELEPQFLKLGEPHPNDPGGESKLIHHVDTLAEADGVMFLCPKCFAENGGAVGAHLIICWRPHVPQTNAPRPGRWEFEGTGYDDLTLVAGSSSILLTSGCKWHGFVRKGEIISV